MPLRIATYNIHRCIGTDRVADPRRIAAVLREIDADIVALQEVAHHPGQPGNPLDRLANAIDATAIEGTTLKDKNGHYGNALLCRLPLTTVQRADISVPGRERRGAIAVTLSVNNFSVQVVATHLGLRTAEKRYQVEQILDLFDPGRMDVSVLLGDLNLWYPAGPTLRRLNRAFEPMPAPATFPSQHPLLSLDRLWVLPRSKLTALAVHKSPVSRVASDHLPVVAELDL
jgi:endonuclease/exonuclease/phosphatase family metal-dependent hydrolase